MHAFRGVDVTRRAFLHQMQVCGHAFRPHLETICSKNNGKGGMFPKEVTQQMPQQFLAVQISVKGKGWT